MNTLLLKTSLLRIIKKDYNAMAFFQQLVSAPLQKWRKIIRMKKQHRPLSKPDLDAHNLQKEQLLSKKTNE